MTRRLRLFLLAALATVLVTATVPAIASSAEGRPDPVGEATRHLRNDADGAITIETAPSGTVRFVGTRAGVSIDNPDVRAGQSVAAAARAHLDRYAAALGPARGTTFVRHSAVRTVAGTDMVRYEQQVDGVPVLGGDVVLGLDADRNLRSLSAAVTAHATLTDPSVTPADAEQTARGVVRRAHPHTSLTVTDLGRFVLDPTVAGLAVPGGARTVRQLEIGNGSGVRQLVLVDDHTGGIVFEASLIERADRVVCDRNNGRGAETLCTSGFARAEGDPATGTADVDSAYDLSGVVSTFYHDVDPSIDLTTLLGIDVSGTRKLASTVRYCTTDLADACPYDNAYWNGQQMFYGQGFAGADDVVGHEMTHGVIDQYSRLFYWGQSGAINESMADIMGEIVDHRHPSTGDSPTNWDLGEDLPGGALRNLANPTLFSQPDRMTSSLYTADSSYLDAGGVHTNSGVGNKTAYLISQGGSFNGQTITGIDASDPSLTKTAKLYLDTIERLGSGADYAALALQLDQSCQDLRTQGTSGFTVADCTAVHQAGLATELATTPTKAAQPADAPTTCPAGTTKRVLLESETDPATAFAPVASGWSRQSTAGTSNATSGIDSWYAEDPGGSSPSSAWIQTNPLRSSSSIALPAGQPSFLSFQGWYLLDYDAGTYYDGGTVEVGVDGGVPMYGSTNGGAWINGPGRTLASGFGNTGSGQPAFSGDSHGWTVSRLDLSTYAGHTVRPQFTMRSDNQYGFIGWYLDDITIYTCDPLPPAPRNVRVLGGFNTMTVTWQPPAFNAGDVDHYVVDTPRGLVVVGPATTSYSMPVSTQLAAFQVQVIAVSTSDVWTNSGLVTVRSASPTIHAKRSGTRVRFKGYVGAGGRMVSGGLVKIQRRTSSGWTTVSSVRTRTDGGYVTTIRHRKRAYYRAAFMGAVGTVGRVSVVRRW